MSKWGEEKHPYLPEKHPRSPHWSSSHYGAPGRAPMDMWIRVTLDKIAAVLYILFNKFTCLAITFCNVNLSKELAYKLHFRILPQPQLDELPDGTSGQRVCARHEEKWGSGC